MEALRMVAAPAAAATPELELFGSFLLGEDEFALPALSIREVVNFPERITALPLAPSYLEGMFTLRGSVIPVVNLARLFDPGAAPAQSSHKIAIIDHQEVQVGLLVHATGEVLRVRPEQRAQLRYADAATSAVVAGTILLEQGRRLIQVLDVERLVRIDNVPQVLALRAAGSEQRRHLRAVGTRRHAISFRAAGAHFALDMQAIQEIIRVPELHASILNSQLCLGRMHFRGQQVAVVDFAVLAGQGPAASQPEQRVLVLRIDGASIGLLVDAVESIVHFCSDEVMPIPLLSKQRSAMFAGCVARPGQDEVILLEHAGIFSHGEIAELQQGHQNLFPDQGQQVLARRRSGRRSYLTFRVDDVFALELGQVREIIDCSGDITRAPGMPDYLHGILNLRQQLVTLVDLRRLYGLPGSDPATPGKVLVIERGEERFGLIVDAVSDIVALDDSKRYATPSLMRKDDASGLQTASGEVLELSATDGSSSTICLLDLERLLARLAQTAAPTHVA
jgi:purine-binding chemotaxis protein CheW